MVYCGQPLQNEFDNPPMGKIAYLARVLGHQFDPKRFRCQSCGSTENSVQSRKYVVTQLRRCADCQLLFRTPTDAEAHNFNYYETGYKEGNTTKMPSDAELAVLKETNFAASDRSWSYYNRVLGALGLPPGARVFDFGCSWGYGSYQMSRAGYSVLGFDIARTRRAFAGTKLGVETTSDMDRTTADPALINSFDCFFSSHVLEHVPAPSRVFEYARQLLGDGGIFVSFTPNGSDQAKEAVPGWELMWGEDHCNFIDDKFLNKAFADWPRLVGSSGSHDLQFPPTATARYLDDLAGYELFFAARRS